MTDGSSSAQKPSSVTLKQFRIKVRYVSIPSVAETLVHLGHRILAPARLLTISDPTAWVISQRRQNISLIGVAMRPVSMQ